MVSHGQQCLEKRSAPTEAEIVDIERLVELCNRHDGLNMRLSRKMLKTRPALEICDFLYYQDDKLVGYLGLESWGIEKRELHIGVVHPDYRQRGIFRQLLAVAQAECAARGTKKLILVSESTSGSGTAAALALRGRYTFSEHAMELQDLHERMAFDDRLSCEVADANDIDALVKVQARSFNDPEAQVLVMVTRRLQDPECCFFLARFGEEGLGCREPVGVLRIHTYDDWYNIYAFGVLPEYRGRGYGRQILEEAVRFIRKQSQKPIKLEVDTTNAVAMSLYQSCGFRTETTYNYYVLDL
ncbi:MAG TPA: GNAT family N-acetyltransferase [Ktedonobacteraceae bacterium]|jgi:ribosomal protein S18 acetylase RimI-like enzyme|nr:GNAT family N-acetyltransferase [Ktedonobacteraceae bacterium]